MPVPSRLRRPLAAVALGAALLAPLQPVGAAFAAPTTTHASAKVAGRSTQATLTAYGDADSTGTIHLSGSLRWADGKVLGHRQHVELWARSQTRWVLVRKGVTDRRGDVELSVAPSSHTTYQLRYAGSRSTSLSSVARPSKSPSVEVHVTAKVTLTAPRQAQSGKTFVVSGRVSPGGAGRAVTLAGNGRTFTTLRTRADGSFSGHVRLRMTTTLSAVLPDTASLDGAVSGPRLVHLG